MGDKPRVVVVGGMPYNVPPELETHFKVVGHITQDQYKIAHVPACEYVFVFSDWAAHSAVKTVKQMTGAPVIWLRRGWSAIQEELRRRGLLAPATAAAEAGVGGSTAGRPDLSGHTPPATTPTPPPPAASPALTTTGLDPDDLWKTYRTKVAECARLLDPGACQSEDEIVELLTMTGLPGDDCRTLLPYLAVRGILVTDGNVWWLASADGRTYEKTVPAALSPSTPTPGGKRPSAEPTPEMKALVEKMRGLPMGPYFSKAQLAAAMAQYREFANQDGTPVQYEVARRRIGHAVALKVVEEQHGKFYIDHDPAFSLTRVKENGHRPEATS